MTKQFVYILFLLFIISCSKDSIQSTPQLKLNSISTTLVTQGSELLVTFRLTDKEGDFNDTIWVQKETSSCIDSDFLDSTTYKIPVETPRKTNFDGVVSITFSYPTDLQPRCNKSDTAVFTFWIKDAKGNQSDTTKTEPIIIQ